MSYDLNLWKQSKGLHEDAVRIYHSLCNGQEVEGLENLPTDQILGRLREDFPGIEQNRETLVWESSDNRGSLAVYVSPQWVRFDCYSLSGKYMKLLVTLARDFHIPIYDPQRNQRYETLPNGKERPPES